MPPEAPIPVPPSIFREMIAATTRSASGDEKIANATDHASDALRAVEPLLRELADYREADVRSQVEAARELGYQKGIEEGLRRAARAVEEARRRQLDELVSGGVEVVRRYVGGKVGAGLLVAALSALAGWLGYDVMAEKAANTVEVGDAVPPGP